MNSESKSARWFLVLLSVVLAVGALFFHLPKLDERPMHADEAVHALKLGILMEKGDYEYNPHEYHGPVIYYAALPFVWATGAHSLAQIPDEKPLRLPIVIFGALLVLVVGLSFKSLGKVEAISAALIIAVSPAYSFYSRYYIQEIPFVFFCFLALAAIWKLLESGKWTWAVAAGTSAGVAIALKETWIMVLGTAGLTAGLLHMTSSNHPWPLPFPWKRFIGLFGLCTAVALLLGLALLSNLFQNIAALTDTFRALGGYVTRGVSGDSSTFGAGVHDHPWNYYLRLLVWPDVDGPWIWTEGGTLALGLVGIVAVVKRWPQARGAWHFVVIFTILITAFYSSIPYKTPWNVLPMLLGWCLLAGRGAAALVRISRRRWLQILVGIILLAWPAFLAKQTWQATIKRPADPRNPYAYSATSPSIRDLAKRVREIADVSPKGNDLVIQIISPANDYWPLPWYLRRFPRIGYYTDATAANAQADIIIATTELDETVLAQIGPRESQYNGLRPEILLTSYIRQSLWNDFMRRRQ
jgi:uncharacterized protein (TIGR03663 family)